MLPVDAPLFRFRFPSASIDRVFSPIFHTLPSPGFMADRGYIYLVRDIVEEGKQRLDPTENILLQKVPFQLALEKVKENKLVDSATCLAILLVANKLGF